MPALLLPVAAAGRQSRVLHTPPPPASPGERVTITFRVDGDDPPLAADVHVRVAGAGEYDVLEATARGEFFRAELPALYSTPPGIEYWISVRTESGAELTAPERSGPAQPYFITVSAKEALERIVILSPEPDGLVDPSESPILSVLFDPPLVPPATATLFLDGVELTGAVELTPDYILYEMTEPLRPGVHEALVVLHGEDRSTVEKRWSFHYGEISPQGALDLSGRMEAGWASAVTASVRGEPYVPYEETSSLRFDLYAGGEWANRSIYIAASRDPIYDEEVRFTGRISSERFSLEVGDIYPSFSELTVSWLSGEGAILTTEGGALRNEIFAVRTLNADTTGGFGTYSQFIAGERLRFERGRWTAAAQGAY